MPSRSETTLSAALTRQGAILETLRLLRWVHEGAYADVTTLNTPPGRPKRSKRPPKVTTP